MLQGLLASSARAVSAVGPGPTASLDPLPLQLVGTSPRSDSSNSVRSHPSPPAAEPTSQPQESTLALPLTIPTPSTSWQFHPPTGLPTPVIEPNGFQTHNSDVFSLSASVPLHTPLPPLPQESDSEYTSFTFHHQATNSYRPLGMPIPPDDFVWSEPELPGRPLKRFRYAEPVQEIVIPSSTPVYLNGGAGGETSPVSAHVQIPQVNWYGNGHANPSTSLSYSNHHRPQPQPQPPPQPPPQPSLDTSIYQSNSHPQWMHPPSLSLPTPIQQQSFDLSHSSTSAHGYTYYESEQISPLRDTTGVNMSGPYNGASAWQAYPPAS